MADPVVAVLSGGADTVDFRVDLRLGIAGPNVDPLVLARPEAFRAGDEALAGVLSGTAPPGSLRLQGGRRRSGRQGVESRQGHSAGEPPRMC